MDVKMILGIKYKYTATGSLNKCYRRPCEGADFDSDGTP